jgi:hypothetical protein
MHEKLEQLKISLSKQVSKSYVEESKKPGSPSSSSSSSFSQKIKQEFSIVNAVGDQSIIGFYNNSAHKTSIKESPEAIIQNLLINTKFKIDSKLLPTVYISG